jgi:hypothetical protein
VVFLPFSTLCFSLHASHVDLELFVKEFFDLVHLMALNLACKYWNDSVLCSPLEVILHEVSFLTFAIMVSHFAQLGLNIEIISLLSYIYKLWFHVLFIWIETLHLCDDLGCMTLQIWLVMENVGKERSGRTSFIWIFVW